MALVMTPQQRGHARLSRGKHQGPGRASVKGRQEHRIGHRRAHALDGIEDAYLGENRLALTDAEKEHFREQLSAILDYAARLQAIDTSTIPPTASVLPVDTVLRDDVSRPGLPPEQILANAPDQEDNMFRVPVILE